jgi:hypothetical protein
MGALADTILSNFSVTSFITLLKAYPLHLLCSIIIAHLIYNKFRPGLSSIPGPALAGWTGLWRLFDVSKGDAHNTAIKLHRKYGSLVRIGPNHVSVGDPAAIPIIYGLKSGFTKVLCVCVSLGIWLTRRRRRFTPSNASAGRRSHK